MHDLHMEITSEGNRKYKYRKWGSGLWAGMEEDTKRTGQGQPCPLFFIFRRIISYLVVPFHKGKTYPFHNNF